MAFYFSVDIDLFIAGAEPTTKPVTVEIQLVTQLSEVITALTHDLYEQKREEGYRQASSSWKWNAYGQDFRSTYIGHSLHLLEGLIQVFRDEVLNKRKEAEICADMLRPSESGDE